MRVVVRQVPIVASASSLPPATAATAHSCIQPAHSALPRPDVSPDAAPADKGNPALLSPHTTPVAEEDEAEDHPRPTHDLPAFLSMWARRRERERQLDILKSLQSQARQLAGQQGSGDATAAADDRMKQQQPSSYSSFAFQQPAAMTAETLRELYPHAPIVELCRCPDQTCVGDCPAQQAVARCATDPQVVATAAACLDAPPPAASVHLTPSILVIRFADHCLLVQTFHQHTLGDVIRHSPGVLGRSAARPLFVAYQLVLALRRLHSARIPHGRCVTCKRVLWSRDAFWIFSPFLILLFPLFLFSFNLSMALKGSSRCMWVSALR